MRKVLLLTALAPVLLAGCTWGIKLNDAGRQVRTAWNGNVSGCQELGKVTVSVMDHVGPIDRNGLKVSDELEVMARNEAASMGADTVKPIDHPVDGQQSWQAYKCGAAGKADRMAPAGTSNDHSSAADDGAPQTGGVQTFPVKKNGG
ncbi:DUF4156 domain-containing protein [Oleiagrimonas sp. C23AA]|uniref:DUF4156 domain-containing protein n=1 Tax=Oleiagrimonas sp. C23AA TaxID=2719047 RepID=UPI00141EB3BF|nr:DUF4156 domain-containing protein [Oleiagrimonas sp. C23AA]NII10756.1 DUF4156 domain-containing protein [Oleiagrimonas sp. C23AA]